MKHLTKEQLEKDLNIRDLSDQNQGKHAMQILMNEVLDALSNYWNCPVTIYRESPIVTIEDNYDKLGIDKESILRNSNDWHKKSLQIRTDSRFLCAICEDKGIFNHENLEVHHIIKLKDNPDLLLEDDNLICLCRFHHKQADKGAFTVDYLRSLVAKR